MPKRVQQRGRGPKWDAVKRGARAVAGGVGNAVKHVAMNLPAYAALGAAGYMGYKAHQAKNSQTGKLLRRAGQAVEWAGNKAADTIEGAAGIANNAVDGVATVMPGYVPDFKDVDPRYESSKWDIGYGDEADGFWGEGRRRAHKGGRRRMRGRGAYERSRQGVRM
jgi:hypothetical protein